MALPFFGGRFNTIHEPQAHKETFIRAGYRLPKPTFTPLAAGEMLVFDPETLHGTHLNVTESTRVALGGDDGLALRACGAVLLKGFDAEVEVY